MDTEQFDRLAREVNQVGTRRGALRLLSGGTLAGALALVGGEPAAARCRGPRKCGRHNCCRKGEICGDKTTKTCVTGKGTCSAGDDYCADRTKTCNDNALCGCLPTKEGGNTRCVSVIALGGCCSTDANCAENRPDVPGAVCIAPSSGGCNTGCENNLGSNGQCFAPCPPPP